VKDEIVNFVPDCRAIDTNAPSSRYSCYRQLIDRGGGRVGDSFDVRAFSNTAQARVSMAFEPVDTPALAPLLTPPLAPPPLPAAAHPCRIRGIYHDDDEAGFDAVAVF
jgi:hypothetical protein